MEEDIYICVSYLLLPPSPSILSCHIFLWVAFINLHASNSTLKDQEMALNLVVGALDFGMVEISC